MAVARYVQETPLLETERRPASTPLSDALKLLQEFVTKGRQEQAAASAVTEKSVGIFSKLLFGVSPDDKVKKEKEKKGKRGQEGDGQTLFSPSYFVCESFAADKL